MINHAIRKRLSFGKRYLRPLKKWMFAFLLSVLKWQMYTIRKFPFGYEVSSKYLESLWDVKSPVDTPSGKLIFQTPTSLNRFRAQTLLTKEPETISWLNEIPFGSKLWDIGANIGIYSIYASVFRRCQVVAVEPSNLNLDLLFRNIQNNNCEDQITILPIAVGAMDKQDFLYMSLENLTWGGAHNSAGFAINQSGGSMLNPAKSLQIIATIDQLITTYNLNKPEYIKIDVDGLELKVLEGALVTLSRVKSILIEVDIKNTENNNSIAKLLQSYGFIQRQEIGSTILSENQIWDKP